MEYAFFFGAQAPKLGKSIDNKPKEWSYEKAGKEVMRLMEKNIPGILTVRDALGEAAKRGFLVGMDGRKLFIRKPHAALNTFTQGNGAILCKAAMVRQREVAEDREIRSKQCGMYHDETQSSVEPNRAEEYGNICVQAIRDIGTAYGLKVALDGDFKVGKSWAETH